MKGLRKYAVLLLTVIQILSLNFCAPKTGNYDSFTLEKSYSIVVGALYSNNSTITSATEYLIAALSSSCGILAEVCTDSEITLSSSSYTVLVGDTKFEASDVGEPLKINDYAYAVISENLIVINGGSTYATLEGVKHFCAEQLGYHADSTVVPATVTLTAGTICAFEDKYGEIPVFVNDVPLEDYRILVESADDVEKADVLVQLLGGYNGFSVPVVSYEEDILGETGGVICLGALDREGEKKVLRTYNGYKVSVPDVGEYTISISASPQEYYDEGFQKLLGKIDVTEDEEQVNITFPEEGFQHYRYSINTEYSTKLVPVASKTQTMTIADGVVYTEYHYLGDNGMPYRANVLYIDTDKNTFHNGTAYDHVELVPAYRQTVTQQMQAALGNGLNVVAGINGDMWYTDNNDARYGEPRGLTIKNGVLLSRGQESFGYFGITKDGEAVIGKSGWMVGVENLQMAIGGSHIIVQNACPMYFDMEDSHCYTSHPRTLVGITDDGDVILAVIDGRSINKGVSSGASMENCADLMASLGAYVAISLDGGGSSTMAVRSGEEFIVKNNPSDGSPRAVINSLLVVGK